MRHVVPGRRRVTSFVCLLVVLCASAAGVTATPAGASAATQGACQEKPLVIGVPGSGEKGDALGYGKTVLRAVRRFQQSYGGPSDRQALEYPASDVLSLLSKALGSDDFKLSADTGITNLLRTLNDQEACRPIVLIGFSQGALVINRALVGLGNAGSRVLSQIASVELIADPQRLGAAPYLEGSAKRRYSGISASAGFYPADDLPAEIQRRTDSYCQDGDLVCATDPGTVDRVLGDEVIRIVHAQKIHRSYAEAGIADEAGTHAASRTRKFLRGSTQTSAPNEPGLNAGSVVSTDSYGPVVVGATVGEAERASGLPFVVELEADGCAYYLATGAPEGVSFMVIDDTVARIDIDKPGVLTKSGFGVGTSEAEILRLSPTAAVTPHAYTDGHYVTITDDTTGNKFVFETDGTTVTAFHAGRPPEVEYIEGCS